uniref:Protein misato homolog 1 n=1 Tax=Oryzias sinensis TaxID=183150 RepID=A0A8C7ZT50_9TELE
MSSLCREVITLQLGHFSNFVGTHWWNLQDASLSYDPESPPAEIRSDVVFREGQTPAGHVTYTPRLIAMDLKGSLQTLRQQGCLYDAGEDASALTWEGSLVTHKESPSEKNSFLKDLDQLDSPPRKSSKNSGRADTVNSQLNRIQRSYRLEGSVRVWSDFLRIHLHPRTVSVIHQYNHDGEAHRLEAFGQGESVLQGALLEELEDRLHFFVEECDYLQGFQILCDLGNGFAGLGSKVTELLQDSYGGRGILSWGLVPGAPAHSSPVKDLYRLLNCTLGMLHMATNSSLFCPLSLRGSLGRVPAPPPEFPHLYFDPSLWFHSSAVLALALDALTVPYRLRNNSPTMWQVADSLVVSGRKVVSAYGAVPFPMMHGSSLPDALTACAEGLPWKPLSTCPERGRCYGQWVTLRGFEGQKLVRCEDFPNSDIIKIIIKFQTSMSQAPPLFLLQPSSCGVAAAHSASRSPQRRGRPGCLPHVLLPLDSSGAAVGVCSFSADATLPADLQLLPKRSRFFAEPATAARPASRCCLSTRLDISPVGVRSRLLAF